MSKFSEQQAWWRDQLTKTLNAGAITIIVYSGWFISQAGKPDAYYLLKPYGHQQGPVTDMLRSWWLLVFGSVTVAAWAGFCLKVRRTKFPHDCDAVPTITMVKTRCYLVAYAFSVSVAGLVGFDSNNPDHSLMNLWQLEIECWIMMIFAAIAPLIMVGLPDLLVHTKRKQEEQSKQIENDSE